MVKNERIIGFDFARGLAIIGMVFVNFKVVMTTESNDFLYSVVNMLSGKAAVLFVVLAGVGMSLMFKRAWLNEDYSLQRKVKISLLKRAGFLFVVGLSYYAIWPADILHFYGIYMLIGVALLASSRKTLIGLSALIIVTYSVLLLFFNYEVGWDFVNLEYHDFFTFQGFFRNLFLNGFHPVFPWVAFMLIGIWIGRLDFNDKKVCNRVSVISFLIYTIFKGISMFMLSETEGLSATEIEEMVFIFGTEPMPPMFFYMITASSLAIFVISMSIHFTKHFSHTLFVKQIVSTGQLALSNYFFHVIIGMLGIQLITGEIEQVFSIKFALCYALFFNVFLIVFSHLWRKQYSRGPLEWVMRKITGYVFQCCRI